MVAAGSLDQACSQSQSQAAQEHVGYQTAFDKALQCGWVEL